jgi:hypothetical protein
VSPGATAGLRGRVTLGVVLIVVGLVLALDQAGVLSIQGLGRWWPLFVIGIGLVKVRQPLEDGQRALGAALLFLGCLLQVMSVLSVGKGWPLIMVGVGGVLLWQAIVGPPRPAVLQPASPFVGDMALIGYLKRCVRSADFRGGYVTAVMGGVELDLRGASLGSGPACLDVFTFWGGIDLKVPPAWTVESKVVPIMGGVEQKAESPRAAGATPSLLVRGYAVMGGVVIGN